MTIFAVHGFLGLPSDWRTLSWPEHTSVEEVDLWDDLAHLPTGENGFVAWAKLFNHRIKSTHGPRVLLGYSLGGRLALHAVLQDPKLFDACVLVSTNSGLSAAAEKHARLTADQKWAARFSRENWSTLLRDWNEQGVFKDSQDARILVRRTEKEFKRELLVKALDVWSLGRQEDLASKFRALSLPRLCITGAKDTKFVAIADRLTQGSAISHKSLTGAGHRVPWDAPEAFLKEIDDFTRVLC